MAIKATIINAEAAADQGMADRLAASFMREIALLKARTAPAQLLSLLLHCHPRDEGAMPA